MQIEISSLDVAILPPTVVSMVKSENKKPYE